jgi:hypothetical protein
MRTGSSLGVSGDIRWPWERNLGVEGREQVWGWSVGEVNVVQALEDGVWTWGQSWHVYRVQVWEVEVGTGRALSVWHL